MLADKEIQKALQDFAKYVIQQSRSNLTKGDKNASKELYNSLGSDVKKTNKGYNLSFEMEDYGKFQDKGVSGTKKKYNTPYSYKSKGGKNGLKGMPPPSKLDKWIVRKGIAPRNKGKFTTRKSIQFAIARSIHTKGIKPSLFFTKPFERAFKRLPDELVEAYAIGIEKQIQVNINK